MQVAEHIVIGILGAASPKALTCLIRNLFLEGYDN